MAAPHGRSANEKHRQVSVPERLQFLVWDSLVRIGHWLVVLFFFVAYFTTTVSMIRAIHIESDQDHPAADGQKGPFRVQAG